MKNYKFVDISHWEKLVDMKQLADLGHRVVIAKASDSYFMPDRAGRYDWVNHTDPYFVDNFINARNEGLLAAGYHFVRFDRPVGTKTQIIQANLDYYLKALDSLGTKYRSEIKLAVLDVEQPSSQIQAAGLGKAAVSDMLLKILALYKANFEQIILYSGSWWTNMWVNDTTMEEVAGEVTYWEAEYPTGMLNTNNHYDITSSFIDYVPSVPKGIAPEFALTADDATGKIFAHQYTDKGLIPGHTTGFDLNRTEMSKEELFKLFRMDGAVDPPPPPPPPVDCKGQISDVVNRVRKVLDDISQEYDL